MKYLSYLIVLILFTSGCDIFESNLNQTVVRDFNLVDVQLKSGEEFIFNLGSLGDEEQVIIKKDSKHASVSKLFYDFDEFVALKYRYQSKPDFIGTDSVILEVRRGSDGASPNKKIYVTVLHFNIQTSS